MFTNSYIVHLCSLYGFRTCELTHGVCTREEARVALTSLPVGTTVMIGEDRLVVKDKHVWCLHD